MEIQTENVDNESVMKTRYSYVWIKGDYAAHSLPRENDLDAFDTLQEAFNEMKMVAKENGIPESHYVIVRSFVTPWEAVG